MPAVRDLDRVRCAVLGPERVGAGPVPADHLHAGMLAQPISQGGGLAVIQHVDGLAGIHVDHQSRIRMSAPFREIIDAQHGDLPDPGIGQRTYQLDQRVPAGTYSQQRQQPGSGPPGQGQRHQLQQPAQQHRPAGIPLGEPRDRLSERPHPARRILAGQTADRERDQDRAPPCGQIMQKPAVVAMHAGGGYAASPARCRSALGMRRHQYVVPLIGHLVHDQFRQVGKEHLQAAGIARHDMLHTGHNEPHGRSGEDQVLGRTRSSRSGRTYARAVTRLRLSRMKPWIPSATAPHRNRQTPVTGRESSALSGRSTLSMSEFVCTDDRSCLHGPSATTGRNA